MLELSFLSILSSIGAKNIGTMQLLFFTFLVATATSFLLVLLKKRTAELRSLLTDRRSLAVLATAGILNYAGAQLFLTLGVLGTNPVIASIMLKLWPIFLAIMIPFTLRTKVAWQQAFALLLAFAGVYLMITNGSVLSLNMQELPYIGLLIASTLCTAVSNVMIKGRNHDIFSEVFLFNLSSLALVALMIPILGAQITISMNLASLVSILFLGAITYSAGSILFFYTLKTLDPLVAANASYSTPILTAVFSYLILGTPLKAYYLYSFALIAAALAVQNWYSKKVPRYRSAKRKSELFLFDVTGAFSSSTNPQVSAFIRGKGRALATTVKKDLYSAIGKNDYDCLIFTNKNPPESVSREEMEFIEETMSPEPDEMILMALGDIDSAEQALNEHALA
jgi:drug/metabolite transporter (DMT)-like permease